MKRLFLFLGFAVKEIGPVVCIQAPCLLHFRLSVDHFFTATLRIERKLTRARICGKIMSTSDCFDQPFCSFYPWIEKGAWSEEVQPRRNIAYFEGVRKANELGDIVPVAEDFIVVEWRTKRAVHDVVVVLIVNLVEHLNLII
jgi:hypothetical protein